MVAVGDGGTLLRSTDLGVSWTAQSSGTSEHLRCVSTDGINWYAAGENGTVLYSTDDGVSWSAQTVDSEDWLTCLWHESSGRFILGGTNGHIRTSLAAANSWTNRPLAGDGDVVSMDFSPQRIIAALHPKGGNSETLIYSEDDGDTWRYLPFIAPFKIRAITGPGTSTFGMVRFRLFGESDHYAASTNGDAWTLRPIGRFDAERYNRTPDANQQLLEFV